MQRRSQRRVVILVASGALLVAANSRGLLSPLRTLVSAMVTPIGQSFSGAGGGIGNFFRVAASANHLASDNLHLEQQNAELRQRLSDDAELRAQNEALRKQLGYGEVAPGQLIPAPVTGQQPDNFRQYLTIGRGTHDGVKIGMAVVAEGRQLVGRISEVNTNSSKVFMLSDPNFLVNGLDQNSPDRATGTVHGQIGAGLAMDKLAQNQVVKVGDTVVTSGLGGELPKGLIIGQIQSVNQSDNAVFQTAQLSSGLKFGALELVFVVVTP